MGDPNTELSREAIATLKEIAEFWNDFSLLETLGGTKREVLERVQTEVSDAMYRKPADLRLAERLTAQAMLILNEWHEF
jgi:hypothetical protein